MPRMPRTPHMTRMLGHMILGWQVCPPACQSSCMPVLLHARAVLLHARSVLLHARSVLLHARSVLLHAHARAGAHHSGMLASQAPLPRSAPLVSSNTDGPNNQPAHHKPALIRPLLAYSKTPEAILLAKHARVC